MATFTALNIDYDNSRDVAEVDDTKELQVEEALKLYQTALKYHSEGPTSFDKAAEAYAELLQSDIFQYPESQSELRRIELYGPAPEWEELDLIDTGPVQLVTTEESAPNTLPQILHLSYKNNGIFLLDKLQYELQRQSIHAGDNQEKAYWTARTALRLFAEALDKDDTDLDLWGSAAGVASLLGSERISRYCLEAVLDDEDEGFKGVLALPGVEEGFAIHQLRKEVQRVQDDLAVRLSPLSRLRKREIADTILQRLNPYKRVQFPGFETLARTRTAQTDEAERFLIRPGSRSWIAIGDSLLRQFQSEQGGYTKIAPGAAIGIDVPPPESAVGVQVEPDIEPEPTDANETAEVADEPSKPQVTIINGTPAANSDPKNPETSDAADVEITESPRVVEPHEAEKKEIEAPPPVEHAAGESTEQSRKRNFESAGFPETEEDGGRVRSKRIRARESNAERSKTQDPSKTLQDAEDRLQPITYADKILFESVGGIFAKLGVTDFGSADALKASFQEDSAESPTGETFDLRLAIKDIHKVAETCSPEVVTVLLNSEITDQLQNGAQESGLNAFLGYTKGGSSKSKSSLRFPVQEGLDEWLADVNSEWLSTPEIACMWVERLLRQTSRDDGATIELSSYRRYHWSEDLKRIVVQMIVHLDERLYQNCVDRMSTLDSSVLMAESNSERLQLTFADMSSIEMIQTYFELHLDVYSLIKQPSSGVDAGTKSSQGDRLERWSSIAHQALQLRATLLGEDPLDELSVRHLWATAFHLAVSDDVSQEHVLLCMHQLKSLLQKLDGTLIELQNNAVMPELSISAIDGELNRIQMKEFFARVFDSNETDPVATIESLEPILELPFAQTEEEAARTWGQDGDRPADMGSDKQPEDSDANIDKPSALTAVSKFLESASVWPRLHLWKRLREAYEQIDFTPKVISCYLRSIELLTNEAKSAAYHGAPRDQRCFMLLSSFRLIDDFLLKVLAKTQAVQGNAIHLDSIDGTILRSTLAALTDIIKLLHTFLLYEDNVRVGNVPGPLFEGRQKSSFPSVAAKLHDMNLRTWMLQYQLLKESMGQDPETFSNSQDARFEFLRAVHYAVSVRGLCKGTNKAFLRMIKEELLPMSGIDGLELELSQVLYDLYGLKCCANTAGLVDHAPVSNVEPLTKKSAMKLLGFIMAQAKAVPPKDLPKLELKASIDNVHGALGRIKMSDDVVENRRMLNAFIKSAINPLELYRCLQGLGTLTANPISEKESVPAAKGWYFLMGNIAFNKYLAQKQKSAQATPIDDLQIASSFYVQHLEYSMDNWETWYRLAQCYDYQLEEMVLWSAEKINSHDPAISTHQRNAIHCYSMAVARAATQADPDKETTVSKAKMYADFGTRIYASTREPFSMTAFELREGDTRFLSKLEVQVEPFKTPTYSPLSEYTAWKYAAALFKRSIARAPDSWWTHYMLGKCLWKMYTATQQVRNQSRLPNKPNTPPDMNEVLEAFVSAIESLPQKRDSRKEPILEPHCKLFSIVYKLVERKDLEPAAAAAAFQVSEYLRKVNKEVDADSWESYVLQLLKTLKNADKSGWHHRIFARAAHVLFSETMTGKERAMGAMGAKSELTQQIFTKTMAVQVWKPENERPGRHFVYTTRYTRFFLKILVELDDRVSMEQLAKRVRRKPQDFHDYHRLWTELCQAYLKLLRRWGKIPEGHEDVVFKSLNHEDFVLRALRLEVWCQDPETKDPLVDVLHDVVELKRVNNGLMKPTLIDDLIGDTYAAIYTMVGPKLDNLPLSPHQLQQLQSMGLKPPAAQPTSTKVGGTGQQLSITQFQPHASQDGPGKSRQKGVGRRELQRRAEAAVTPPVRSSVQPSLPVKPSGTQTVQVVIPSQSQNAATSPGAVGGTAAVQGSAPGSVHDSADDESGSSLSELDEENEPENPDLEADRPMFPNLRRESVAAPGSTAASAKGTPDVATDRKKAEGVDEKNAADVLGPAGQDDKMGEEAKDSQGDVEMKEGA